MYYNITNANWYQQIRANVAFFRSFWNQKDNGYILPSLPPYEFWPFVVSLGEWRQLARQKWQGRHVRIPQTQLLAAACSEEEAIVNNFSFFSSSSTAFAPPFHHVLSFLPAPLLYLKFSKMMNKIYRTNSF